MWKVFMLGFTLIAAHGIVMADGCDDFRLCVERDDVAIAVMDVSIPFDDVLKLGSGDAHEAFVGAALKPGRVVCAVIIRPVPEMRPMAFTWDVGLATGQSEVSWAEAWFVGDADGGAAFDPGGLKMLDPELQQLSPSGRSFIAAVVFPSHPRLATGLVVGHRPMEVVR